MKQGHAFCAFIALVFFCSFQSYAGQQELDAPAVTVVNANNQPIAGASVMIGYAAGNPFADNVLTTDAHGIAALPAAFHSALPITIQAAGYVSQTLPPAAAAPVTVQLSTPEGANQFAIGGTTNGYGTLTDDGLGTVNFGLVIPAIERSQLLSFSMANVLSPQTDNISLAGKTIPIPSNVALPDQHVTYIFSLEINKPNYRSYVRNDGTYAVSSTHGSFPLGQVARAFSQGQSMFDMVNSFTFMEGGMQTIEVNGDTPNQNLAINTTPFNQSYSVKAPTIATGQVMVSMSLQEQAGLLYPTDLKRLTSGQSMNLQSISAASAAASAPSLLSILLIDANASTASVPTALLDLISPLSMTGITAARFPFAAPRAVQTFNQMSYALEPVTTATMAPQFLPLIPSPTLDNSNVLHMSVPTLPSALDAVATYIVLTEVQTFGTGPTAVDESTRLWEIWSPGWIDQFQLPTVTVSRQANRTYRWNVMFLARPVNINGSTPGPNGVDLNSITHVTRNILAI